jgi:multicomponent K+:H+ antiporter subunit G
MSGAVLSPWLIVPAAVMLATGGLVALTGALGLLRLRTFYSRMHPPTMGATLGTGCVLVASMLVAASVGGRIAVHELLIGVFLVLTSPVTAILLMRAGRRRSSQAGSDSE